MAVTLTSQQLADRVAGATVDDDGNIVQDVADELLALASALVTKEAAGAPDAVANQAVTRVAGYLAQMDAGPVRSETIGPRSFEWVTNHSGILRRSGAKGLLSPWKRRRVR